MNRTIISLLVAGLFAGGATAALAQNVTADPKAGEPAPHKEQKEMTNPPKDGHGSGSAKRMHDKGETMFKKADKDNDGTLDKKEAKSMPRVARNFEAIDTDKDGTVSREEIHTYMKDQHHAAKK